LKKSKKEKKNTYEQLQFFVFDLNNESLFFKLVKKLPPDNVTPLSPTKVLY
jgi:hypothetical protein